MLVIISLIEGAIPIVIALLTRSIINQLAAGLAGTVVTLAAILSALAVVQLVGPLCSKLAGQEISRAAQLAVRERLFQAVNSYDGLAQFDDPKFHDHLRLAEQAGDMAPPRLVSGGITLLQGTFTAGGFVLTLFALNPLLGVLALTSAVPVACVEFIAAKKQVDLTRTLSPDRRLAMVFTTLQTDERAVKEIRLFGLSQFLQDKMSHVLRGSNSAERRHDVNVISRQMAAAALSGLIAASAIVLAVFMARRGALTTGDIAVVLAAVASVQVTLAGASREFAQVSAALALLDHFHTVITLAALEKLRDRKRRPAPLLSGAIRFEDVSFRYDDEHPWVLRHFSLTIDAHSVVALVGLNGAGKSTVVKLLCRLYDPTEGHITWAGLDLKSVSTESLRARISVVFQDFMAYELTAEENIGVGNLSAINNRAAITSAARSSDVHNDLKKLPHGYRTLLSKVFFDGEGALASGTALSGGQWQRVAVARALLRSPCDLTILDEPSSGLDADAEHQIHMSLKQLRGAGTSILISHRLNTVRDATNIVVIGEGRVSEQGNHDELLSLGGTYARLFSKQAAGYLQESAHIAGADAARQFLNGALDDA